MSFVITLRARLVAGGAALLATAVLSGCGGLQDVPRTVTHVQLPVLEQTGTDAGLITAPADGQ